MAGTPSSFTVDDADLLTEVPAYLKKLARMVARGFYSTAQILIIDALVRDPCVKEEDLSELLHMDKKMLRQALIILRRDRLIKSISHTEKVEGHDQPKKFDYYFINFKSFVNVLKYKLDHMRKKIEADEKIAKNRQFYRCPRCGKEYGDLDVNQLFDPMEGLLRCTYCRGEVEEDQTMSEASKSTTSVAELNELTKPLLDLIRQCENVKLAPTVLEPEPKPIRQLVERRIENSNKDKSNPWKTGSSITLYDNSAGIQITLNEDDDQQNVVEEKQQPSWLAKSTVHVDTDAGSAPGSGTVSPADTGVQKSLPAPATVKKGRNHILTDLLIHESRPTGGGALPPGVASVGKRPLAQRTDDDSSSDDDEAAAKRQQQALGSRSHLLESATAVSSTPMSSGKSTPNDNVELMEDGSDDNDDEPSVKIGGESYSLSEVTGNKALLDKMTEEEMGEYQRTCHQFYADQFDI